MDLAAHTCKVPGCGGPRSGVCINGLNFEECPDVVVVAENDSAADDALSIDMARVRADAMVSTGGVSSLDAAACDAFLRAMGGTVIGLVAGPEVGKTTMIATMYELIHRGRMTSFRFAGSETLRGYEERCHLARMASNGMHADTPRTPTWAQLSFTHLRLVTSSGFRDVIFSDRSGEHFDNVLDQPSGIAEFAELARADIILLVVGLDQLLKTPHQPTSQIRRLFMAMDQQGLLRDKVVSLVGTKADLMTTTEALTNVQVALDELAVDLNRRGGGRVQVTTLVTSSRPRTGSTEIGEGLEALLTHILKDNSNPTFNAGSAWPEQLNELDALMFPHRSESP